MLSFFIFGCQLTHQCSQLPRKTRLRNDQLCVEWDVKPYSLTMALLLLCFVDGEYLLTYKTLQHVAICTQLSELHAEKYSRPICTDKCSLIKYAQLYQITLKRPGNILFIDVSRWGELPTEPHTGQAFTYWRPAPEVSPDEGSQREAETSINSMFPGCFRVI